MVTKSKSQQLMTEFVKKVSVVSNECVVGDNKQECASSGKIDHHQDEGDDFDLAPGPAKDEGNVLGVQGCGDVLDGEIFSSEQWQLMTEYVLGSQYIQPDSVNVEWVLGEEHDCAEERVVGADPGLVTEGDSEVAATEEVISDQEWLGLGRVFG